MMRNAVIALDTSLYRRLWVVWCVRRGSDMWPRIR